jgi:hypothetical protein
MIKRICYLAFSIVLLSSPAAAQFAAQQTFCSGSCVGGTGNAIVLHIPNVTTLGDLVGVPIRFVVGNPNTGPATLTVGSAATEPIMKIAPAGLVPLIGGELPIGPPAPTETVIFDGVEFVLQTGAATPVSLIAPLNYYVSTSGNDSNNCLTLATSCLTIQHAITLVQYINLNGFSVTVNVANGAYQPFSTVPINGSGQVLIIGNTSSPSAVTISAASGPAIGASNSGYVISGLQLSSAANGAVQAGACILASGSVFLQISNINFGSCFFSDILSQFGAIVTILGADEGFPSAFITIVGNSPAFVWATAGGQIGLSHTILNTNGAVTFSAAFAVAQDAGIVGGSFSAINITGSVSGQRFSVIKNAIVDTGTGNLTYFPGSSPGQVNTQGQYF